MCRFLSFLRLLTGVFATATVACSGAERPGGAASAPPRPAPADLPAAAPAPVSSTSRDAAPPRTAEVAVRDPAVLARLDANGFSLGKLAFGSEAVTTAELARSEGGKSVLAVVNDDVRAAARAHPHARVTSVDGFRLFDTHPRAPGHRKRIRGALRARGPGIRRLEVCRRPPLHGVRGLRRGRLPRRYGGRLTL